MLKEYKDILTDMSSYGISNGNMKLQKAEELSERLYQKLMVSNWFADDFVKYISDCLNSSFERNALWNIVGEFDAAVIIKLLYQKTMLATNLNAFSGLSDYLFSDCRFACQEDYDSFVHTMNIWLSAIISWNSRQLTNTSSPNVPEFIMPGSRLPVNVPSPDVRKQIPHSCRSIPGPSFRVSLLEQYTPLVMDAAYTGCREILRAEAVTLGKIVRYMDEHDKRKQ